MADIIPPADDTVNKKIHGTRQNVGRPAGDMRPKSLLAKKLQDLFGTQKISVASQIFGCGRTAARGYLTGAVEPPMPIIMRVVERTGCSIEWLLHDRGPMYLDLKAEQHAAEEPIIIPPGGRVGATEDGAAATFGNQGPALSISPQIRYLSVHGRGLLPLAGDGHMLIMGKYRTAREGDIVVAVTTAGVTHIRRYHADEQHVTLAAINPSDPHPFLRIPWSELKEVVPIVGVWFG
jgi:hypothetical protein